MKKLFPIFFFCLLSLAAIAQTESSYYKNEPCATVPESIYDDGGVWLIQYIYGYPENTRAMSYETLNYSMVYEDGYVWVEKGEIKEYGVEITTWQCSGEIEDAVMYFVHDKYTCEFQVISEVTKFHPTIKRFKKS